MSTCPRHGEDLVDTLDAGRVCLKCEAVEESTGPTALDIAWEARKARERRRYAELRERGWR